NHDRFECQTAIDSDAILHELRTESVRTQTREQFTGAVDRIFDTAESVCVASVVRTALRAVRDTVVSVARAVWNWIFF
ncbi:GTPase family protein, partial [Escherichia coli]|nr:GTPase family protein [Escherichia coli]